MEKTKLELKKPIKKTEFLIGKFIVKQKGEPFTISDVQRYVGGSYRFLSKVMDDLLDREIIAETGGEDKRARYFVPGGGKKYKVFERMVKSTDKYLKLRK